MPSKEKDQGFTLLELMAVLGILALLLMAVPRIMGGLSPTVELRGQANIIYGELTKARAKAIASGQPIEFDVRNNRVQWSGLPTDGSVKEGVALHFSSEKQMALLGEQHGLIFYPTGGSSGGVISIEYKGQRTALLIDWLTGEISQQGNAS